MLVVDEHPLTAEDCAIGEVVAGKYLVEGVIGRGSMGVVVRATHLGFDELVALKFIRPEMRKVEGIVSRFAREAKASVRIRNQHAVNVLDVGVADPLGPFFVMEYLEGVNLEELVDSQGAFDTPTAVKYVLEACEALAAAHAQGIIHRDIKPQNLFLAWQGRLELIKILDFGISKAALSGQVFGDDLSSGEQDWVMGTPLYMSPEQLRHAPDIDERTDIWSLGAVLYELVCGQPLFSGNTQTAVCRQVFEAGSRSIRVDVPGVPDALWEVIERCLSQQKEQRFANVAELGQALLRFAPPVACLHVERARAMLGLEPLEFLGFEDELEVGSDALGERAEPAAVPLVAATPAVERRGRWVEVAVPLLACAVAWVGYRQWQMNSQQLGLSRTDDAIRTVAHALRQRADCPVPRPAASPTALASARVAASSPVPGAPEHELARASASADLTPDSPVAPGADDGAEGSPPPLVAQHASGARRAASAPAAPHTPAGKAAAAAPSAAPSTSEATAAQAIHPVPSAAARRAPPKPTQVEPRPVFRLIDEHPARGAELVPRGDARRVAPPLTSSQ